MFVRIKREDKETTLETDRYDFHDLPDEPNKVLLDVGEDVNHHQLHKARDEVYVMNGEGRTIETYRWPTTAVGMEDALGREVCTGNQVLARPRVATGDGNTPLWRVGLVKLSDGTAVIEGDWPSVPEQVFEDGPPLGEYFDSEDVVVLGTIERPEVTPFVLGDDGLEFRDADLVINGDLLADNLNTQG